MDLLSHHTSERLKIAYMDQLKEYLLLANPLKHISQKHKTLQLNLSKLDNALSLKTKQKDELISDIQAMMQEEKEEEGGEAREDEPPLAPRKLSSLLHRVFGVDTLEDKRAKLLQVQEEEQEAEHYATEAKQNVNDFVDKSVQDLDMFDKQKAKDVSELMEHYVINQININDLGREKWTAMKEAFMKL